MQKSEKAFKVNLRLTPTISLPFRALKITNSFLLIYLWAFFSPLCTQSLITEIKRAKQESWKLKIMPLKVFPHLWRDSWEEVGKTSKNYEDVLHFYPMVINHLCFTTYIGTKLCFYFKHFSFLLKIYKFFHAFLPHVS